jgi:hypothetical protein
MGSNVASIARRGKGALRELAPRFYVPVHTCTFNSSVKRKYVLAGAKHGKESRRVFVIQ